MSILDTIQSAKDSAPKQRTLFKSFYEWYDAQTPEDRQALDDALRSPEVSTRQLFRALKLHENVPWGDSAIYFHASTLTEEN